MAALFADENVPLALAELLRDLGHYHRLHRRTPAHAGIVTFTDDPDTDALAVRIHAAIAAASTLAGALIRIVRPP